MLVCNTEFQAQMTLVTKFVIPGIYRNRSNFHGTNISRIHKLDIIRDFIFTNPYRYKAI